MGRAGSLPRHRDTGGDGQDGLLPVRPGNRHHARLHSHRSMAPQIWRDRTDAWPGDSTLGMGAPRDRSLLRGSGSLACDTFSRTMARMAGEIILDRDPREYPLFQFSRVVSSGTRVRRALVAGELQPVQRVSPAYRPGVAGYSAAQPSVGEGSARQRGGYCGRGVAARRVSRRCLLSDPGGLASGEPPAYGVRAAQRRFDPSRVDARAVRNALRREPRHDTLPGRAGEEQPPCRAGLWERTFYLQGERRDQLRDLLAPRPVVLWFVARGKAGRHTRPLPPRPPERPGLQHRLLHASGEELRGLRRPRN